MLSARLSEIVDAVPLARGTRVLEIGCGTGVAAHEVAARIAPGRVVGIDRSARAVAQATALYGDAPKLALRVAAVEEFELDDGEDLFDIAFAVRVGALDGRHPELVGRARRRIHDALAARGRLYIDGGDPSAKYRFPSEVAP